MDPLKELERMLNILDGMTEVTAWGKQDECFRRWRKARDASPESLEWNVLIDAWKAVAGLCWILREKAEAAMEDGNGMGKTGLFHAVEAGHDGGG